MNKGFGLLARLGIAYQRQSQHINKRMLGRVLTQSDTPILRLASRKLSSESRRGGAIDLAAIPNDPMTSTTLKNSQRNQDLENIVRQGIGYLNQTAIAIQNDPRAQKNLFSDNAEDEGPNARQLYEEHRILKTAQECLERLHAKNPAHPFVCATGEPIVLLRVSVNTTYTHANLYWSLPYSVLSQIPDPKQRLMLQSVMEKRVMEDREFLSRVHGILMKGAFSPRVRMKVADFAEVQEMMESME